MRHQLWGGGCTALSIRLGFSPQRFSIVVQTTEEETNQKLREGNGSTQVNS